MAWQETASGQTISEIALSSVLESGRIDAEYFDPDHLRKNEVLLSVAHGPISDLVSITDGNHLSISDSFTLEEEGTFPYFRGQDITGFFLNPDSAVRIPKDVFDAGWMRRSYFKAYDVLLSIVGTIGNLSLVPEQLGPATGSCKIAILRPDHPQTSMVLTAFLSSEYGQFQLRRMTRGAVQMGIILKDIPTITVPRFGAAFAKLIATSTTKALEAENLARTEYSKANKVLLEELGLEDYKPSTANIAVRRLEDSRSLGRFDAEYWQPKYDELADRVSGLQLKVLGELVTMKKGIEPGSEAYGSTGKPFIRVSDFSIYGIEDTAKRISDSLFKELADEYQPEAGEVLFTKDGTVGIAYAIHKNIEGILSGAFLRLRPKEEINIDYLALVLNSLYCKMQIERLSGGAVISHIKPASVEGITIPLLPASTQAELSKIIQRSNSHREQANSLLMKVRTAMETYVEEGEKAAMAILW